jgi:hypothetical protein
MDFVTAWKATSVVLTGAFGILGLLKDFKNKETGQVTKWGRVSLAGILLSSGLGVVAQLKESSDQERSRQATANQTLALAQKTDLAVRDLQRLLSPFDEPRFNLFFYTSCENPKFKTFCSGPDFQFDVTKWPKPVPRFVLLSLDFFVDAREAQEFVSGTRDHSDLRFSIAADARNHTLSVSHNLRGQLDHMTDQVLVRVNDLELRDKEQRAKPYMRSNKLRSALDLAGATLIVSPVPLWPSDLGLEELYISLKNGQEINVVDPKRCATITVHSSTAYKCVFPEAD